MQKVQLMRAHNSEQVQHVLFFTANVDDIVIR